GVGFVTRYSVLGLLVILSVATLPFGPTSSAWMLIRTVPKVGSGKRLLRGRIFSSVVRKRTGGFSVVTTVPSGIRMSLVVRFLNCSWPIAFVSSVREPVAVPVVFAMRFGSKSVSA